MTRKTECIEFLKSTPENSMVGIYLLDKSLGIVHYNVYNYTDIPDVIDRIFTYSDELEKDLVKIVSWAADPSEDYLRGIYDEIVKEVESGESKC